jgi:hypothetical protein
MKNSEKKFRNPDLEVHRALALWATTCAERTLPLFEASQPADNRPSVALQTLREWARGERTMMECRAAAFAAHAAARQAVNLAAVAAARATGQAAAVAHMYTHARHAGEYAVKAACLAVLPTQAVATMEREKAWQWAQLREDLRLLVSTT